LNFFTSSNAPIATLMDMDGTVVKTWSVDPEKTFPGIASEQRPQFGYFLRDAELMPDGGIVGLLDKIGLVRLDADSRVLWTWPGRAYHDVFIGEKGQIWTLLREKRVVPGMHHGDPVWDDFVVELSPEGKLRQKISLVECLQRSPFASLLANQRPEQADLFHTNSLVVLDGSLADRAPFLRRGNVLISMRSLNCVVVVEPESGRIVWALTGQWFAQHCARFLPNGHILLFDNLGSMRRASRVLEIDPLTQEILWSFGGTSSDDLFSETVGWVQRLPGGNTLITESNFGRVIEVTPEDRVVWEYQIQNRLGKKKDLVPVVYFMVRVPRDLPFLKHAA
jgi:hypothetical protein